MINWWRKLIRSIRRKQDEALNDWVKAITKDINDSDQIQHP